MKLSRVLTLVFISVAAEIVISMLVTNAVLPLDAFREV